MWGEKNTFNKKKYSNVEMLLLYKLAEKSERVESVTGRTAAAAAATIVIDQQTEWMIVNCGLKLMHFFFII